MSHRITTGVQSQTHATQPPPKQWSRGRETEAIPRPKNVMNPLAAVGAT